MIWRFRDINQDRARQLAADLGQPHKVGEFLAARGFRSVEELSKFTRPDLRNLPKAREMTDMDLAVERLLAARKKGETVAVCGDYDADGLTAAAVLTRGFGQMGLKALARVPNRLTEGYGLKPEAVRELAERGVSLIVTVDNGISDYEAAGEAGRVGLDLIVTDHHQLPPELPPALAVINPHRDPALWGAGLPAGVGVAFMLLGALKGAAVAAGLMTKDQPPDLLNDYLPLVAIGTIADLVPLTGGNRILAHHGLNALARTRQPGLVALKKIVRLEGERISPRDVGFSLAPRLNAAGRLGSAEPALELLLAETSARAAGLAQRLEELNRQRHQGQTKLCAEALERLEEEISPDSRTVILGGENWPRGLLGLAASRVADSTGKPTVLFSLADGLAVGSGRSAGNFNLYEALNELRHLFVAFGGHAQAAGLTLAAENLPDLREGLEEAARSQTDFTGEAELWVDLTAELGDLNGLAQPLARLEPFGQANPVPVVVIPGARVADARPTASGGDKHIKMVLGSGLDRRTVVGFNLAPRLCQVSREMDLALALESAESKGQFGAQWRLLDFRPPS